MLDEPGGAVRTRLLADAPLCAPALVDAEYVHGVRGLLRRGLADAAASAAIVNFLDLPLVRHSLRPLVGRMWDLRDSLSAYDAAYVALAESLEVSLLTADTRLARAHAPGCRVELVTRPG